MAIFNKQLKYTREQLLNHYQKNESKLGRVIKFLYGIIRFLCIIIENLYCVPSYLVLSWAVLMPINWLNSALYSRLENYLYNSLLFIVSSWSLAAGATIVESGSEYKHLIEEPGKHDEDSGFYEFDNLESCPQKQTKPNEPLKQETKINGPKTLASNGSTRNLCIDGTNEQTNDANDEGQLNYPVKSTNLLNKTTIAATNGKHQNHENNADYNNCQHALLNGDGDVEPIKSDSWIESASIDYQVELASAAGERKLIDRSFKTNSYTGNNNTLQATSTLYNHKRRNSKSTNTLANNGTISKGAMISNNQTNETNVTTFTLSATPTIAPIQSLKNKQAKPRILFLCNHISTADVPLIMQSFSTLTNQSILWVLDAQFKTTNFGVVCCSHGDFFVAKNSYVDGSLREQVLKHPDRNLLVLFPEGGFLRKRIEGSNRYATRNGYPLTKYVTHPRFGAFKDLIDPSVGVTHIVDATLLYDDIKNPMSIIDIAMGTRREPAILNYKLYKRSEINPTEEWLRNIWLEKDKLLEKYYQDRSSFLRRVESTLRTAQLDWFKVLAVHLFYLLVCYLAIFRLFSATSITMLKARELYYSNM